MALLLVFGGLLATACNDVGRQAASSRTGGTPPVRATANADPRQRIFSLLPPPEVSFQVIFRERTSEAQEGPYLVWTQGHGMRRWDWVGVNSGKATSGDISIDTRLSSIGLGDEGMTCGWYAWPDLPPGQVDLRCSAGSGWSLGAFLPVADAVRSYVTERLPDQAVAGRKAACYSFDYPIRYSVAVFCVDSELGIPLLLTTVSPSSTNFSRELEAISVSTAEQNIVVPEIEFDEHPVLGPRGKAVVPYSSLQLPDFSRLEE